MELYLLAKTLNMFSRKFDGRGGIVLQLDINGESLRCDERVVFAAGGIIVGMTIGAFWGGVASRRRIVKIQAQLRAAILEAESIRLRAIKDVAAATDFGSGKLLKDLLPTCDNLDHALASPAIEASLHLKEGIQMTRNELYKVLASHGVEPIKVGVGDKFDHDLCEAMMQTPLPPPDPVPSDDIPTPASNTISTILSKGYTHNSRILRPAKVGVYK